jgi:hypothetical protein
LKDFVSLFKSIGLVVSWMIISIIILLVVINLAESGYSFLVPSYDDRKNPLFWMMRIYLAPAISMVLGGVISGFIFRLNFHLFFWPLVISGLILRVVTWGEDNFIIFCFLLTTLPWIFGCLLGFWIKKRRLKHG